jgi:hypothetical protein
MGADSRADSGTDHFHRARTRFHEPTVGQTIFTVPGPGSRQLARPLRRAVAGPTDFPPLSDRPLLSVANLAVVRGSRLSARPFLHGRGKEPLTEGQTFSRDRPFRGCPPLRERSRTDRWTGLLRDPPLRERNRTTDRWTGPLRWWVPSIPWEPTVEPTVGQTIFTVPGPGCRLLARPLRRAVAGPTDFPPLSDRPLLSALTEGQTFSRVPDNRPDLFAGWANPDGADNGTGLLSVLLPVGRWMDGGRADDRQMARPLRETSSRDRAGGGVGGATDGANRRAWLGLVALRGADLRRRRYRCAGRGERSSRGSGVGRWWR